MAEPTIPGIGGDDILIGAAGDDILYGAKGADTLEGGAGEDWLKGGWDGNDTIYEYSSSTLSDRETGNVLQLDAGITTEVLIIGRQVK